MSISWRAGLLTALGAIPVIFFPNLGVAWAWVAGVIGCVLLDVALAFSPRDLTIERSVTGPVRANDETVSSLTIGHSSRHSLLLEIRDAWPPSFHPLPSRHRLVVHPGETTTVETRLRPERRGTHRGGPVTVRVWGPLRLGARQVSFEVPLALSVLPEFRSRVLLPSRLHRLHELEGTSATVLRGPGTEFDSLREYVRGDDPRDIDWRASARSDDLIVRTWRPERDRHIVIVVDSGRMGASLLGAPTVDQDPDRIPLGTAPRLDASIEAALLLGALGDRAGDHVHLLVIDREVRARVSGIRGAGLLRASASALVDVSPRLDPIDWGLVVSEVNQTVRHSSLVVLMTEVAPAGTDSDFFEATAQLAAKHRVVIAAATDPDLDRARRSLDDSEEVMIAAAAAQTLRAVDAGIADARRTGAHVVAVDSGLLAARTADAYLALKKAGEV
ncbi:DUF58 domain-containing protein [Schaalia sp. ZJ405]|uniref:DUF58 domain-containing protein n=1 Tax=unclassified Schaalia TaxID=2691889 RepID=UPI0013EAC222|nr:MULTISPECIES: DUF58 domain-containing protein [unclassified Schaalia]QPK81728.1 DUF58 domain-containing protein [Schaalia sp. ZJ405]